MLQAGLEMAAQTHPGAHLQPLAFPFRSNGSQTKVLLPPGTALLGAWAVLESMDGWMDGWIGRE